MSTAYELQIYQNGQWQFDSYFDDKDTVVSEAERMNSSGRFAGVRVLKESYKDNTNTCEYHVIYSRLGKDSGPTGDWRDRYQGGKSAAGPAVAERDPVRRNKPRSAEAKKSNTGMLIALATVLLVVGVGTMIALHTMGGAS